MRRTAHARNIAEPVAVTVEASGEAKKQVDTTIYNGHGCKSERVPFLSRWMSAKLKAERAALRLPKCVS